MVCGCSQVEGLRRPRTEVPAHGVTRIARLITDNGKIYVASAVQRSIHSRRAH